MREEEEEEEEDINWFARWEKQLPSPDELMPLSQSLITPDLALAFDIPLLSPNPNPNPNPNPIPALSLHHPPPPSSDLESSAAAGYDDPARTLKRPRLVWTPQLHKRFVDAVAHLGIRNAVPKTIMQLMSVDGLTRENVASHLQKYRLYLKRMQGLGGPADAAADQLFDSAPVPHQFLARGPPPEPFLPVAVQQPQQYYNQRHLGHFGSPAGGGGGFDHGFLNRAVPQLGMHQMAGPAPGMGLVQLRPSPAASSVNDLETAGREGSSERKVLTLFPTGALFTP